MEATGELLHQMVRANGVSPDDLACVLFTTTPDLNAEFPAAAARELLGWHTVPLMCSREIDVPDSPRKCLRIMMLCNTDKRPDEIVHVYTRGASELRKRGTEFSAKDAAPSTGEQT